jgi:hypothetical protein
MHLLLRILFSIVSFHETSALDEPAFSILFSGNTLTENQG